MIKKYSFLFIAFVFSSTVFCQDDLLSLIESTPENEPPKKVYATFKTTKVISAQTIETVKKHNLDYRITHRFGNLYNSVSPNALNEAAHSSFGLDNSADIRMSFDYGITDEITIGIGRSKYRETYDGVFKWRFLTQTVDNKIPVSLCFYGNMAYTSMSTDNMYAGTIRPKTNEAHRLTYLSQLIVARKFNSRLSLELLPTYTHRNFIKQQVNSKGVEDENGIFSLGFGGRLKLSKRLALLVDYFYNFSEFQKDPNSGFYNPLAVGLEIETGGHVFHVNVTNAAPILESNLISYTQDRWTKGQIKLGFNISRVFAF